MSGVSDSMEAGASGPSVLSVAAGQDHFDEQWGLDVSAIDFKATTRDTSMRR